MDYSSFKELSTKFNNYYPQEYVDSENIGWIFHQAVLIISRSGANTSQEIVALNQKSILIPLPYSQQNEQLLNAQYVKENLPNHTIIIPQEKLNTDSLYQSIIQLEKAKILHHSTKIETNPAILKLIHELI